ncbi:MAG: lipopolysaccharide biosynthesis protein [Anaeromyxobacter sp.]
MGGATLAVGLAVAAFTPSEYTASSTVQLEPRRLSVEFLPAQGVVPFEDRMRTVKHGILARPVLERVLQETDFFPDMHDDREGAIEKLRRQVEVRLEGEVPGGGPSLLFVVEVRGRDPQKVKAAAELLPRAYEEMTRQVLQSQAQGLRETLDAQVKEMGQQLAEDERRILAFKVEHLAELPEMVETNARSVGRAQALIELRLGAIAEAQRRRTALLGSVPEGVTVPGMAEAALDGAVRRLQAAEAAYSPDHPDVRRARRELAEALGRRDEAAGQFRELRVKEGLARIEAEIADHQRALEDARKQLDGYQRKVEVAPRWGQELANLSRDYEALRAKYAATVSRRADAAVAEGLLAADTASMFHLLDPAITPTHPSAPDRGRLALLAVLAALALALAAAALTEWADGSMRGPEDAGGLGVPVLATIPRIGPRRTQAQ